MEGRSEVSEVLDLGLVICDHLPLLPTWPLITRVGAWGYRDDPVIRLHTVYQALCLMLGIRRLEMRPCRGSVPQEFTSLR